MDIHNAPSQDDLNGSLWNRSRASVRKVLFFILVGVIVSGGVIANARLRPARRTAAWAGWRHAAASGSGSEPAAAWGRSGGGGAGPGPDASHC